ncbi:hypothetical protein niasHT_029906 [Heterodera trifolii]|uniref:Uncharacterized protein n=1 Tax=Heterodera trifolii TaxID=157864 RepID=A0ABD2KBD3_9BILA
MTFRPLQLCAAASLLIACFPHFCSSTLNCVYGSKGYSESEFDEGECSGVGDYCYQCNCTIVYERFYAWGCTDLNLQDLTGWFNNNVPRPKYVADANWTCKCRFANASQPVPFPFPPGKGPTTTEKSTITTTTTQRRINGARSLRETRKNDDVTKRALRENHSPMVPTFFSPVTLFVWPFVFAHLFVVPFF